MKRRFVGTINKLQIMLENYSKKLLLLLAFCLVTYVSDAQTLLHYWNFNTVTDEVTSVSTDYSIITGSSTITYPGTGDGYMDEVNGTDINVQNGDVAGGGLRVRNPSNTRSLIITIPTTNYEDIMLSFAVRRTGSGATEQYYTYSTDGGTTYTNAGLVPATYMPTEDFALVTIDLSALTDIDNNGDFIFKIDFGGENASGSGGNNRFDNFAVMGNLMAGAEDTTAPLAIFNPTDEENFVATTTTPTILFNEDVRLIDNTAITNANAASVIELRLDNASGDAVPFTTTYTGNTITIIPTAALLNNQEYYIALLANTIEDMSDNAIVDTQAVTFTTISEQTEFVAGDMVIVGYRMNATSTEDEVAILTLKDITEGTFIFLTDSKYTSNPEPQCDEAIMWTADQCVPAGSVITVQTSEMVSNSGTVTGDNFGLSSGGDQVIIYTGSAAMPNYITALSSNAWLADNTSCGGSESMIPLGLVNGINAISLATAPDNTEGNTVNAYYNGTQTGTMAQLRTAVLNPANWVGADAGTAAQTWPVWNFPSAPTVQEVTVVNETTIELVFNNPLNAASAGSIANYTGISGLNSATVSGNTVTLTFSTVFTQGSDYELMINNIQDSDGLSMACGYNFSFTYSTELTFDAEFMVVNEDAGSVSITLNLENPATSSVDLVVKGTPFSTADSNDFTYTTTTLTFSGSSSLTQVITIPIIDDNEEEQHAEYFVLSLENAIGVNLNEESIATIYIKDNDKMAPVPSQEIELDYVMSFDPSGTGNSTCEIVVYDAGTQRLFATSADEGKVDIINFTNPSAPATISSIDMNTYGGVTSVAVYDGLVAVASPNADEQLNGSVVFFDTDGTFINQVTVGALPDNISFTPDGTKVITANEGQPNQDYSIDPEGTVSVIDVSGGAVTLTQANVTTIDFTSFNAQEASLMAAGVRKLKLTSTLSQDFEPEYVTVSADSQTAWVALQENNAIAKINLTNNTVVDIWALGTKDVSVPGNGFDISDRNGEVLIANWPFEAFYIPDAIASYNVGGVNYIVTANEGDEKEYGSFEERTTIGSSDYMLDPVQYPQEEMLMKDYNAGRMRVSNLNGNLDADAEFEQIYCVGTRSFSIFNADTKQIVYDSGDDFEMYTANDPAISTLFNSDNDENEFKSRSRAKGPEPEGVTIANISDRNFAFIGLERVGGVMVYDITNPDSPVFADYKNTRSTSEFAGDNGPEGIIYINDTDSPDGKRYIILANEVSGTLTIFEIDTTNLSTESFTIAPKTFTLFPNPSVNGIVYFNRAADIEVYAMNGKLIHTENQAKTINTTAMAAGIYIVKTSEGIVKKLIIR